MDRTEEQLISMMPEWTKSKTKSVRSARKYLRSIGMPIDKRGNLSFIKEDSTCKGNKGIEF